MILSTLLTIGIDEKTRQTKCARRRARAATLVKSPEKSKSKARPAFRREATNLPEVPDVRIASLFSSNRALSVWLYTTST